MMGLIEDYLKDIDPAIVKAAAAADIPAVQRLVREARERRMAEIDFDKMLESDRANYGLSEEKQRELLALGGEAYMMALNLLRKYDTALGIEIWTSTGSEDGER